MKKLLTIAFAFGLIYFLPQQMHANLNQEQEEDVEVVEAPAEEIQEEPQMTVAEAPSVGFTQELKNRFIEGGPGFMGIVLACLILGLAIAILISTYKNKVASYNSDTLVLDDEISKYYDSNFENFLLYEDIIKGRYVRLNKNNFNLNEIKRRFRRFNEQDLTFFDSISLQLLNYSLNDTTWVNKDLFFNKIPVIKDEEIERIVKKTLYVVKEDSLDVYLIKINDFININDKAPLDYIYNRIEELIKNKKRVDFIKKFETETIENAKIENNFEIIK